MNKIKCYINSNYIEILRKDKIIHINSKSIEYGQIIDSKLFIKDIKNSKLFSNIFTYDIDIYLNKNIKEKDSVYYKLIFEELNAHQIKVYDTSCKIINPTLIECNPIYILFYNDKYYHISKELLEDYLDIYSINKLNIISSNKLKENNNCNYYYYNLNNNIFLV